MGLRGDLEICAPSAHVGTGRLGPLLDAELLYIDNFIALSVSSKRAAGMMRAMLGRLRAVDIVAEEEPEDSPVLGFVLQGGQQVWAPTANKFWRLAYTFEEAGWGRRHFSGKEVSRMLGHAASVFGLRHELFAGFFRAYVFAQENDGGGRGSGAR